jgi:hypothetical protein
MTADPAQYEDRIEETMPATDPTLIHAAVEVSGGILYILTAMIIAFGILVVAFSIPGSHPKN